MFAIAFDLTVADTLRYHPVSVSQAYSVIKNILQPFGFNRGQGSLHVTDNEDMSNLFLAILALRSHLWFPPSVRDIRDFPVEQWSDFTALVKLSP